MSLPPRKRERLSAFLGELPVAAAVKLCAAIDALTASKFLSFGKIGLAGFALLVASCASSVQARTSASQCIDPHQENIRNTLLSLEGKTICIRGPVRVQPHGLYFDTVENNDSLYGGKIYIPVKFAQALRDGVNDMDVFDFTGILRIERNSNCSDDRCFVYYLDSPEETAKAGISILGQRLIHA